jgi:hypothetical protein
VDHLIRAVVLETLEEVVDLHGEVVVEHHLVVVVVHLLVEVEAVEEAMDLLVHLTEVEVLLVVEVPAEAVEVAVVAQTVVEVMVGEVTTQRSHFKSSPTSNISFRSQMKTSSQNGLITQFMHAAQPP